MKRRYTKGILTIILLLLLFIVVAATSCSSNKVDIEKTAEIDRLKNEAEKLRAQIAEMEKQLMELDEQRMELELQLEEWEGLIPHHGIGEFWVEGTVLSIDEKNRVIKIEQHFDDNSVKVNPKIHILPKAIIQERVIDLSGPTIKVLEVRNYMDEPLSKHLEVGGTASFLYRQVDGVAKFVMVDIVKNN
ncbi:MAG: hypothetical protein QME73_07595 [Bacillota bacterium]|nr:hypothetical protein [Bacillota bacterium]